MFVTVQTTVGSHVTLVRERLVVDGTQVRLLHVIVHDLDSPPRP
jgi:hypothetical protein